MTSTINIKSVLVRPAFHLEYEIEDFSAPRSERWGYGPIVTSVKVQVTYYEPDGDNPAQVGVFTHLWGWPASKKTGKKDARSHYHQVYGNHDEYFALEREIGQKALEEFLQAFPQYRDVEVSGP